ncbi:DinB family protein [Flavivirga spongiicola]|uniref:DinB family protein n=1 Tax=Flavivirga spongiicola TaxID=421621 RepID=A0ABU7XYY7_9FLAO|nr:DinB family protein [Flavivirga sp. MEBiC05379]MDO5981006.1 DinB family protein [Flavivirga sp. MEBiC05379]
MKVTSEALIAALIEKTRQNINQVEVLNQKPINKLNWKANEDIWSVLECIEHLNLYGDYYLPEIEQRITKSTSKTETHFKAGILGDYFAKILSPKEKLNKMKTLKDKNPNGSHLDKTTLERFLIQQEKMLELLDRARSVSLNKTKTGISISKLIKLKLGDTFRVVIYHNERHVEQAKKALENYK